MDLQEIADESGEVCMILAVICGTHLAEQRAAIYESLNLSGKTSSCDRLLSGKDWLQSRLKQNYN